MFPTVLFLIFLRTYISTFFALRLTFALFKKLINLCFFIYVLFCHLCLQFFWRESTYFFSVASLLNVSLPFYF